MRTTIAFILITGSAVLSAATAQTLPAGTAPQTAATPRGVLLVANQRDATASLIDLATGKSISIPVGDGPHETAISHDGKTGAVSIYGTQPAGNRIAIIDLKSATVSRTIDLGTYRRPHGMAFLPGDSKLVATSEASSNVVVVDIASGAVDTVIPTRARGSHMLAVPSSGNRLFTANVGDGSISEIDLTTRAWVASYPIATQTEGIAISPDGRWVFVGSNNGGTISVFDTKAKQVVKTISAVGAPYRIGVVPDGHTVIAADPPGSRVNIIDSSTFEIKASVPLEGGPEGIAITPDSRFAFITLNDGNEVGLVDIVARRVITKFQTGAGPDGIAYSPVSR